MTSVKQMITHAGVGALAASAGVAVPVAGMAPAAGPQCASHGNVTAWKIFNGDQAPGLGAAFLEKGYVSNTATPS